MSTHPQGFASGVSVCIATYRRPAMLRRLLESLEGQTLPRASFEVIVVDNDPKESARETVADFSAISPLDVTYRTHPEPNIAKARNEGVRAAGRRWLAFVDDDEWAEPNWLEALLEASEAWACDAVLGPVLPEFPQEAPDWVVAEGLFERKRHRTGAAISYRDARTSNALVSNETRTELDLWFEVGLGRIGAEDSLFFRQLEKRQGRIVWCDEAAVHETVLPERMRRRWLLKRAFRGGQSYVLVKRYADGVPSAALEVSKGLLAFPPLLALGILACPVVPGFGFRTLRRAAVQIGKAAILTPFRYKEYEPSNEPG